MLGRNRKAILAAAKDAKVSADLEANTEVIRGLRFLYENYNASSWYWELVEMSRKVIMTSGLILVRQESRSYIGLAWAIAGLYGAHFAWNHPILDVFENRLMTVSIAVTVLNLGVGAVSKIPAENLPSATEVFTDTVVFSALIVGANTLVVALLACKLIGMIGVIQFCPPPPPPCPLVRPFLFNRPENPNDFNIRDLPDSRK